MTLATKQASLEPKVERVLGVQVQVPRTEVDAPAPAGWSPEARSPLTLYLKDAVEVPLLSIEEENALAVVAERDSGLKRRSTSVLQWKLIPSHPTPTQGG